MDGAFFYGLSKSMQGRHNRQIADWQAAYEELEQYVAQLTLALKVEQANVAGLEAEVDLMRKCAPASPALRSAGLKFQDGTTKTVARITFESNFDKHLKAQGIANPAQYRRN